MWRHRCGIAFTFTFTFRVPSFPSFYCSFHSLRLNSPLLILHISSVLFFYTLLSIHLTRSSSLLIPNCIYIHPPRIRYTHHYLYFAGISGFVCPVRRNIKAKFGVECMFWRSLFYVCILRARLDYFVLLSSMSVSCRFNHS
jgi:hypothetical protein